MKICTCIKSVLVGALAALFLPFTMVGEVVEFNACNPTAIKEGTVTVRAVAMFNISPSGYFTRYTTTSGMNSQCGGALGDGIYYEFKTNVITNPTILMIQKWNYPALTRNGGPSSCPKVNLVTNEVAYNPVDKLIYGCFMTSDKKGWEFGALDPAKFNSNYERTTIKAIENKWMAMAFTPEGLLYVVDEKGDLYSVKTADGAMTKIGATGYVPKLAGSATVDERNGDLYAVILTDTTSDICKLDTKTGKATPVINLPYGEQMRGLHIFRPDLAAGVPGYAENINITFDKGSRSGKASFTMPSKLFGGESATGTANYVIKINSKSVAEGSAAFGAEVKDIAVTADADGIQMAEVIVSNSTGDGPSNKLDVYVGKGTPKEVENLNAVYGQGEFTVSWDAVTASTDGCFIDPEAITYTVTRLPDNVVVAEKTKETTVKDKVSIPLEPVTYSYSVVANYEDKVSAVATSKGTMLGAIQPPYSCDFATEATASLYTIINANNDVAKWTWSKNGMVIPASNTMDMNDWLITPTIYLKAGYAYLLSLDLQGMYLNVKEKFEVKLGKEPEASAMTISVIKPTEVILESKPTQALVIAPEDGMYYIGIHAISAKSSAALYLKSINLGEALLLTTPQAVTDLKATPAADASNDVTISFTTPTKSIDGKAISSLTKIELYRGETLVKTFDAPATGSPLSYKDEAPAAGDVTYNVIPFNADGKGQSSLINIYAGVNYPGEPTDLNVVETSTEGTVSISWKAPETDVAGFKINGDLITYDVYSAAAGTRDLLAENVKELTFTHVACKPGDDQKFMQYAVIPKTTRGEGTPSVSTLLPVGTSYKLPFKESFSYGSINHILGTEVIKGSAANVEWIQCTAGDINKYEPSDNDNGFIAHYAKYTGQSGRLFTGKIDVDAQKPLLWFSTYCINESHTGIIRVEVKCDNQWKELKAFQINVLAENTKGWYRGVLDLSEYKGKVIQLGFTAETSGYAYILLDDIRLFDAKNTDLALVALDAPLTVEAGKEYTMSLGVENNGVNEVAAHDVEISLNGENIATAKGGALKPGKQQIHDFKFMLPVNIAMSNDLQATIKLATDENLENNTHTPLKVNIASGSLPAVKNLKANNNQGEVIVTWDAAETKGTPICRFGFEDMTSWTNSGSDWSFIDADQAPVTGINGLELPNITTKSKQSWWVMDSQYEKISAESDFRAKSGSKFLASMALFDNGTADDWAITPELTGNSQTIGFFARSFHGRYPESFEVLYSTSGKEIKDFTTLAKIEKIPYTWTEYSFIAPAGTKYLAVRHNTTGGFMLYLDEFVYTPVSGNGTALSLEGYHVVADGKQLTEAPIKETSYKIAGPADKIEVYPVYAEGLGSAAEVLVTSNIEDVDTAAVTITGGKGVINITGCENIEINIVNISGINIYNGLGTENMTISVPAGVYIVKVAQNIVKISVK